MYPLHFSTHTHTYLPREDAWLPAGAQLASQGPEQAPEAAVICFKSAAAAPTAAASMVPKKIDRGLWLIPNKVLVS